MGQDEIFIATKALDQWLEQNEAELVDHETLRFTTSNLFFTLTPAVRFLSILAGTSMYEQIHLDSVQSPEFQMEQVNQRLLGRVMTEREVVQLGGESLEDTVLFDELGFVIESGFLASATDQSTML